jgi:SlyX protein
VTPDDAAGHALHGHIDPADRQRPAEFESNACMERTQDTERRLTELEIKASFTEDLVDQLNEVLVRQQQQIDLLIREITQLRDRAPEDGVTAGRSLREELPPHY